MSDLAAAIADMDEARRIHIEWAEYLRGDDEYVPEVEDVGTAEHHDEWVAKYDRVVSLLRSMTSEAVNA